MKPRVCALIAGAALVAALVLVACARHGAAPEPVAPVRSVTVAPVVTAALGDSLHAVGLLAPKDEARLSFKLGGVIESVRVDEGAHVRGGQLLAVLRQAEIGAAVEQARAAAAKATRDLERTQALYADGVATLEQLQDLTTAATAARAALASAEFNSAYTRIVAPADGVVLRKLASANEIVQAGQPVLIVGGAARGWIDRDVVRVRLGDPAEVSFDAWPGRSFAGRVSNLASAADPGTGTFTVEVQVAEGELHFVQGLVAKVALAPASGARSSIVPVQALLEASGNQASVFVFEPARRIVHRVTVRIGRMSAGQVEVLDGLVPGNQVVTDGAAFLENGESVHLVADGSGAGRTAG